MFDRCHDAKRRHPRFQAVMKICSLTACQNLMNPRGRKPTLCTVRRSICSFSRRTLPTATACWARICVDHAAFSVKNRSVIVSPSHSKQEQDPFASRCCRGGTRRGRPRCPGIARLTQHDPLVKLPQLARDSVFPIDEHAEYLRERLDALPWCLWRPENAGEMRIDLVGYTRAPAKVDVSRVLMGCRRDACAEQPERSVSGMAPRIKRSDLHSRLVPGATCRS
jgi:hypothetical protein